MQQTKHLYSALHNKEITFVFDLVFIQHGVPAAKIIHEKSYQITFLLHIPLMSHI